MNAVLLAHVAAGSVALAAGAAAATVRKGSRIHARAGSWFFGSMLVLGATASMLEPLRSPPGSPVGGIVVCYFVATSWVAARRRDGTTGRFEIVACTVALGLAALMAWGGFTGATTPAGRGPVFALAGLCLLAGLLDLNAILRRTLAPAQRLSRHLWRMCFAFFMATGSFFLGQQDVMPEAVRGSLILFVPAFAPFAVMAFWIVRLRVGKRFRRMTAPGARDLEREFGHGCDPCFGFPGPGGRERSLAGAAVRPARDVPHLGRRRLLPGPAAADRP